jgi:aryl-alcohol dehydrogenase-like predicted oxidoreductase
MDRIATISRLTLGTAQIGMPYGVVNETGGMGDEEAIGLMDIAWRAGINCIDTASVYGNSENRIGTWIARRGADPVLISKMPALSGSSAPATIETCFAKSAAALGIDRIDAYLCHCASDFSAPKVREGLERLLEQELIGHYGVSVYTPGELEAVIAGGGADVVQLPVNLANPVFVKEGTIEAAAKAGSHIFVRSVYLQGVLLSDPDRLPDWLSNLRKPVRDLRQLAREADISVEALALGAVHAIAGVRSIVVGANTTKQLEATLAALNGPQPDRAVIEEAWSLFAGIDPDLTDPRRWPAS